MKREEMTRAGFLSDAELERFMVTVRERRHKNRPRDHAFFALLANTGIRPSEALALLRCSVVIAGPGKSWIRVRRLKKRGQQYDDLGIPDALADALRPLCPVDVALDTGERLFPFTARHAGRLYHHYAALAGIARPTRLYILRHTAATRLYRATRDIRVVQQILGHEKPDTTSIYAHVPRAILRDLVDTLTPHV